MEKLRNCVFNALGVYRIASRCIPQNLVDNFLRHNLCCLDSTLGHYFMFPFYQCSERLCTQCNIYTHFLGRAWNLDFLLLYFVLNV